MMRCNGHVSTCSDNLLEVDEAEEVGASKAKGLRHFVLDGGRPGQTHEGALERGGPAQTYEGAALSAACKEWSQPHPRLLLTAKPFMHAHSFCRLHQDLQALLSCSFSHKERGLYIRVHDVYAISWAGGERLLSANTHAVVDLSLSINRSSPQEGVKSGW
jgi:hypothetical protein